jgi:hypothetical protein
VLTSRPPFTVRRAVRAGLAGRSAAALALLAATGCDWVALATGAVGYQTVRRGEAANLVAHDSVLYVTLAEQGIAVLEARTGEALDTIPPMPGGHSADDLALADDLLFVLDAREPGHLGVYSVADPTRPRLIGEPRAVPVGPFSGVSAAQGWCLVSGGTSSLTAWRYDGAGVLTGPIATADLGRGQPDVLVAGDGTRAYVSTHYWGPRFGLDVLRFDTATAQLETVASLELEGAGFTAGGAKPANFPIASTELSDHRVLVAHGRGVTVIATAGGRPRRLATITVGGPAVSVAARGDTALVGVAGARPALVLVDLARATPEVVRRIGLSPGTATTGVTLTTHSAVVAARGRGVLIFDR